MRPAVSVIVVTYQSRGSVPQCLDSLRAQQRTELEAIVVENASSDGTGDFVAAAYPEVRLLRQDRNTGFAVGCNVGARASKGEFLLFLNPDAALDDNALADLLDVIRSEPDVAVAGPRLLHVDGSLQRSAYRFPTAATELTRLTGLGPLARRVGTLLPGIGVWLPTGHFDPHDRQRVVDFVTGACMLVRRDAFDGVGGFDERYFLYYEEIDLCRRLRDTGWKVIHAPGASAAHSLQASSVQAPQSAYVARHRSRAIYHARHSSPATRRAVGLAARIRLTLDAAWFSIRAVVGDRPPARAQTCRRLAAEISGLLRPAAGGSA